MLVPQQNVVNLMLRTDVRQAVAEGRFHLYPVRTVDEGIEILTGVPAGERDPEGVYPPDSINGRVDDRLRALAEKIEQTDRPRKAAAEISKEEEAEPAEEPPREPDLPGDRPESGNG